MAGCIWPLVPHVTMAGSISGLLVGAHSEFWSVAARLVIKPGKVCPRESPCELIVSLASH